MTATIATSHAAIRDADRRRLRELSPSTLNVFARKTEAVTFFRELRSGEILLGLLLLWSLCSMGLRSVTNWPEKARWASLSEGALRV